MYVTGLGQVVSTYSYVRMYHHVQYRCAGLDHRHSMECLWLDTNVSIQVFSGYDYWFLYDQKSFGQTLTKDYLMLICVHTLILRVAAYGFIIVYVYYEHVLQHMCIYFSKIRLSDRS